MKARRLRTDHRSRVLPGKTWLRRSHAPTRFGIVQTKQQSRQRLSPLLSLDTCIKTFVSMQNFLRATRTIDAMCSHRVEAVKNYGRQFTAQFNRADLSGEPLNGEGVPRRRSGRRVPDFHGRKIAR